MGSWALRPYGVELLSTNQSESFNAILKLTRKNKTKPISCMVLDLLLNADGYIARIKRGHYRIGGTYTLRPNQHHLHQRSDPDAKLPAPVDCDKILENIKARNAEKLKV